MTHPPVFLWISCPVLLFGLTAGDLSVGAQNRDWPADKAIAVAQKAFVDLQVIDHHNLRRYERRDTAALREQVAQIKRNMDVAAQLGFTSYLLFQEEAFPELLTWGGKHQPDGALRRAVREALDHATARGLRLYLHCNEFMWPKSVGVPYGDTEAAWTTYRNALKELIALYPEMAGFQVTADEASGALETREGVLKFHNETACALQSDGRERLALMRTWQRVGGFMGPPSTLGDDDESNVIFSVKNTDGDFRITKGFDEEFICSVKAADRLLVEFDAWREYETHNVFPVWLGDYWSPRFQALARAGVKRVGVRFNWNSGRLPITERPWANWVNVFAFVRLAENPFANPDDILREFVALYYPHQGRAAAFDVYKASFEFTRALYYVGNEKLTDHGRVNRTRKLSSELKVDSQWLARAETQTKAMLDRIERLPAGIVYRDELRKGALVISYLAKTCAGQYRGRVDHNILDEWRKLDPESFEELRGTLALESK